MSDKNSFTLKDVSKTFEETQALSSVSLSIEQGEIIALIGPSGAGKTTLLNILSNIIQPDEGKVRIYGKAAAQYSSGRELARKVGLMRQQFDLVGPLPVIHNVLAGKLGEWGLLKSMISFLFPRDKDEAADALERVGLLDKMYDKTSNLSGGEQQRVALARLFLQKPQAILADEPVASLDPARAEDIMSMLVQMVQQEKQTLVASLHSIDLARKYCNRLIALKDGSIYFDLPTAEVTDQQLTGLYQLMESKDGATVAAFS